MQANDRELLNFELSLVLKNHLMLKDVEELQEFYGDEDRYVVFLDTMIYLLNHEPAFFFISKSFLEKAHSVFEVHRFDIKNEEIGRAINNVTLALNEIENCDIDDEREILYKYINWEISVRKLENASVVEVLDSMSDDIIIYFHLKGSLDASSKEDYPISNKIKLASINYLTEMVPEFFMDEEVSKRTTKMIDDVYKETSFFDLKGRKASKKTKQKLKSLYREE